MSHLLSHRAEARAARLAQFSPARQDDALRMKEATLQAIVAERCSAYGLKHYHTHRSDRSEAGYPDSTILGRRGVIYRELKTETKPVSKEQNDWLVALRAAGLDADVWRPTDLMNGRIDRELGALGRIRRAVTR